MYNLGFLSFQRAYFKFKISLDLALIPYICKLNFVT